MPGTPAAAATGLVGASCGARPMRRTASISRVTLDARARDLRPDPRRAAPPGWPSVASPPTAPARSPTRSGAAAASRPPRRSATLPAPLRDALDEAFRFDTVADTELRVADGGPDREGPPSTRRRRAHRVGPDALPGRGRVAASGTRCASRARPAAPSAARSARPASSGFTRDLETAEIVDQVRHAARRLAADGQRLTNIVFMGMGEPLLNLDRVLAAVEALNDPAPVRARRPAHHGLDLRRRARDPAADRARAAVHARGLAPRRARSAARRARAAEPALAGRRGRRRPRATTPARRAGGSATRSR